ncbi:thiamine phosphate synthase [Cryobacterium sp. 1639]|uniref:thiamine phosphate synthase n=1 Tax=Cryobacterium inferilacus TaxID=2866629 RepID=UPI001C72E3B2|nr:thiamine phosphate synthase [Cryobacterium sp. 1639]MBX0300507.1 thiamine phosphate synthase [Cryobacterium sp. 1639]
MNGAPLNRAPIDLSLYLVTDTAQAAAAGHTVVDVVRHAVAGGVSAVQVREKHASAQEFLDTVLRIADELPDTVALIVNDRVDVFLAARAAGRRLTGVHVGQSDLPVSAVRDLVGFDAVIGLSASTDAQLRRAADDPALIDYVGIGALHPTRTKTDAPPALGLAEFARLVGVSTLPAVAIGGVGLRDLAALRECGAAGAAVVSAICAAPHPDQAARELRAAWGASA